VDQSQAQRELSAPTLADTKRSLIFNGLARFPMTALYVLLGIAVGAVFVSMPDLQQAVQADYAETGSWDYLVPRFVLMYLPTGVRALIFAAILAAAMSSLDSAINSLSASTMRDFIERLGGEMDDAGMLRWSRITTVLWGAIVIGFAFVLGGQETVVEGINKVGSAFYGPILAVFLIGVAWRRASGTGVIVGCLVGVGFNLVVWVTAGDALYWMWWNLFGTVAAVTVAAAVSLFTAPPTSSRLDETVIEWTGFGDRERSWLPVYAGLVAYFGLILAVVLLSGKIMRMLAG